MFARKISAKLLAMLHRIRDAEKMKNSVVTMRQSFVYTTLACLAEKHVKRATTVRLKNFVMSRQRHVF